MSMDSSYPGNELEIFSNCTNWKKYWVSLVAKYIDSQFRIIELGSGIGSNFPHLKSISQDYFGIEPDSNLVSIATSNHPDANFMVGLISSTFELVKEKKVALLYIDVLEHIKDDFNELNQASSILKIGDFLIVVVPAHQYLFSPFDKAVGHHRRYSKKQLQSAMLIGMELRYLKEIDFIGYLAAMINSKLTFRENASLFPVRIWDFLIPLSKIFDNLFGILPGKSIVSVWEKTNV